ncbi:MAG: GNAT family N-acetyltransferase [Burkholderiaceae bacterium]
MNGKPAHGSAVSLRCGDWALLGADAGAVRSAVFVVEQGIPAEEEWDSRDADSLHCVAYAADGTPVGTGRLLPDGHIGRMAVLADWRSAGIGSLILLRLIEQGDARGHRMLELSAQCAVEGFYRRHGFSPVGEPYDEVGIAHVRMQRAAPG